MATTTENTTLFDLLATPDGLENPYALYARLRAEAPVHWDPVMRSWVLTRYADVVAALQDPRLTEERITPFLQQLPGRRQEELRPLAQALSRMMLFLDPPDHTRLRGTVVRAFTPPVVRSLQLRMEETTAGLLDAIGRRERFDVIDDFSLPLSASIIADLLAVPEADRKDYRRWTSLLKGFFAQSADEVARVRTLKDCFRGIVAAGRTAANNGILNALLDAHGTGALDLDELFSIYLLLFDAGQVTTANLIGNGVLALLRHPDQLRRLREEPALMGTAVAELLRYDGPVQFTSRIARETFELGGERIEKGAGVILMLAAANRDPNQFPHPDQLDVGRTENRHLSFGYGIHYCLGASLALLEAQIAIRALLARYPRITLAGQPQWEMNLNFRFLQCLPVVVEHTR